ncbi:hypothetical protein SAMN05444673_3145 [Bacillus sp. OV166]|uniref:hypothetical protein n=1 Tax=Bacillus sp. OV166 TaxID=1882763 RepID=UPI000A2ADBF9|nr:hypothetical protein [Bacillus sp. OV166]SMQ77926.1 hypothetical protein SAMN05444673_3145 [Bacillus sp. OV166]
MNRWIIGVLILLLVGGSIYMFTNKNDYKEAPYAAGMNFDLEKVEPFITFIIHSIG